MRRAIVAANWKMHKTRAEARALVEALLPLLDGQVACEVVIAPPFTALETVVKPTAPRLPQSGLLSPGWGG